MSLRNIHFNYKSIKKLVFNKKFIIVFLICLYTISLLIGFVFIDKKTEDNLKITNLPYQEKVANGVWTLKNRDSIKQVLADGPKADLNLKENKSKSYKWSVKLSSGTVFSFGKQEKGGILPNVRIVNSEGWFVEYSPKEIVNSQSSIVNEEQSTINNQPSTINNYVTPEVKGNVISWKLPSGVVARYTMQQDRVKADYVVDSQWLIVNGQKTKWDGRLEFDVVSGNINNKPSSDNQPSTINNQQLTGELMPGGDIDWFSEIESQTQTLFTFPAPIVKDSNKKVIMSEYDFSKAKAGEYSLAITLSKNALEEAQFPLTIDPVVIDSTATAIGTAYGNGRKILRDAWGNLIAVFDGDLSGLDNAFYKNYNSATWVDAAVNIGSVAGGIDLAADLNSSGNVEVAFTDSDTFDIMAYARLTVTRNGSNQITAIAHAAGSPFQFVISGVGFLRPSLIVANKGGGAGVEKIAVAYAMNGTNRGEIRFLQCDVADNCTTAANWKNASEEINGSGTCSDTATSGAAGLPNAITCKGTADKILGTVTTTSHHAVLTQIPGKPKRTPTNAKKFNGTTYTDLTNALDDNTGTTSDLNSLDTTDDFLYIGDTNKFSNIVVDIVNTNTTGGKWIGVGAQSEYCSAVDGSNNCTAWTSVTSLTDYTADGASSPTPTLAFDGSLLIEEPSNWVQSTVDGVTKYWVRLQPQGAFDSDVTIAEFDVTDRNSQALLVVAGVDSTDDLGAAYVPWNFVQNDRWEDRINVTDGVLAHWIEGITALDTLGGDWTGFTNFPLTSAVDYKNNAVYVSYVEQLATDVLHVKKIANNVDPVTAANWTDTSFPTVTEAADIVLSLTSDGADIYLFYVLDVATNSLVFRRCTPSGGGGGNICDNSADWGSEKTLSNSTDVSHPQAVVTKVTGDTIAIDTIYTMPTALDVVYERHYVDMADKTVVVAASGDDAYHIDCHGGLLDQQPINFSTVWMGGLSEDANCSLGASDNHAGFRFPNITVAQGAAISSAYIDLRVSSRIGSTPVDFTIYGQDVDNASSFVTLTNCTDPCTDSIRTLTRTTTSSTQSIDFVTNTYRIDVTDLVQEIICRGAANSQPCVGNFNGAGTWASGNALAILMISTEGGAADNFVNFVSQDDAGTTMLDPTIQINVATTGKNYSLGSATQLATGSASFADFDHPLSTVEMSSVATDDTNYASVSATTNYASQSAQPAFMFKVNNSNNNNTYKIDATTIVKSTLPTSTKPVYLQVYRGGSTNDWVTMASNNNTAADNDITLTSPAIRTSLSEYYFNETPGIGTRYAACTNGTANCWVYWRVYQDNPTTTFNDVLAVDYVNVTFTVIAPDKIAFSNPSRTLTYGACNGTANVFIMELQDGSTPANPLATTVVRVTSNASSYTIYSDPTCTTVVTNGDFTYTTSENTKSVYIIDTGSIATHTLTGTRQSGDILTTGTQDYTLIDAPSVIIRGGSIIRGGTTLR